MTNFVNFVESEIVPFENNKLLSLLFDLIMKKKETDCLDILIHEENLAQYDLFFKKRIIQL